MEFPNKRTRILHVYRKNVEGKKETNRTYSIGFVVSSSVATDAAVAVVAAADAADAVGAICSETDSNVLATLCLILLNWR